MNFFHNFTNKIKEILENLSFHPFKFIKKFMPKSLFGRSLIILVTPLILVQVVMGYLFFDRHTEAILQMLSSTIAGDVEMVTTMVNQGQDFKDVQTLAHQNLNLDLEFMRDLTLDQTGQKKNTLLYRHLGQALQEQLNYPYYLSMDRKNMFIWVQLNKGALKVTTSRKRLFSQTTPLVLIWTAISAVLLFIVASLFMRNQIRPIRRLAVAADRFGKGQEAKDFQPEGASEVRKAGLAFIIMRDRLRRYISERTKLLAGVSHDLRTPLTRLKLQLALMEKTEAIQDLQDDVDQMQQMIEGFLAFAKKGEDEESKKTNIYALLRDVSKPFKNSSLFIDVICDPKIEFILKSSLIKRCLTNLLLNAQRYAKHVVLKGRKNHHYLEIIVDDDGPGIPKEKWEDVFKPFFRLDDARNQDTGGVGLGLSIARDGIRSHGGQIILGQSPSSGLRVYIKLPQ